MKFFAAQGFITLLIILLAGCSDSNNSPPVTLPEPIPEPEPEPIPFEILYEQGVDQYLGEYTPMTSVTGDDGIVQHTFGAGDGPLCLLGDEYTMATREAGDSEDLMIFLEGGGACSSLLCQATTTAAPGIPERGILDPAFPITPPRTTMSRTFPIATGRYFPAMPSTTPTTMASSTATIGALKIYRPRLTSLHRPFPLLPESC